MSAQKKNDAPRGSRKRRRLETLPYVNASVSDDNDHQRAMDALDKALKMLLEDSDENQSMHMNQNRKLDYIPGLINRIMKESSGLSRKYDRSPMLIKQLLRILLKYLMVLSESYDSSTRKTSVKTDASFQKFKRIATQWANNCIFDLVKPHCNSSLPVLDALLAESGGWDGKSHEFLKQDALATSLTNWSEVLENGDVGGTCKVKHKQPEINAVCRNFFNENEHDSIHPKQWQEELQKDPENIKHPFLAQMKYFIQEEKARKTSLEDLIIIDERR